MHDCLIAFGSNQGNSLAIAKQTIDRLHAIHQTRVVANSRPLRTMAVGGPENQNPYVNSAIRLRTSLSPEKLHEHLVQLESSFGRVRKERWGSRIIDLDLLLFDQMELRTEQLILPHPRMSFRRFVLEPAVEIAAEMLHVPSQKTIEELLAHLNDRENRVLLVGIGPLLDQQNPTSSSILLNLDPDWKVESVFEVGQFHELAGRAKLVCFVVPEETDGLQTSSIHSEKDLLAMAVQFGGPTLQLPNDREKLKMELLAAMKAMMPL